MSQDHANKLARGEAPVYLIHGDETFLTREAAQWLKDTVLSQGVEDFNLDRFDARDNVDPERIVQAARTLPMMAPRRFIWVRNAEVLFGQSSAAIAKLIAYVESPDPSSCVLLQAMSRVKKNGKLYKRIAKHGCVLENGTPRERELIGWVRAAARRRGRTLQPDAAAMLVEAIGRDLAALDTAIERLTLFVEGDAPIGLAAVEATVPHTRVRTVWELIDAVAERNVSVTLQRAHQLLSQGEEPLRLLALIIYQFRQLLVGRAAADAGATIQDAARQARVPRFKVQAFGRHIGNYRRVELLSALERLAEADRALKSSKMPSDLIFEGVLLDLCAPR